MDRCPLCNTPETLQVLELESEVVRRCVGVVMKNSGGSANPVAVEKVIRALLGERVSFVELPRID